MTKIYLVRHGETDWNIKGIIQGQTNIPLNKTGEIQARECGEYFKNKPIDAIISSPLMRAKKTTQLINQTLNLRIIYEDRLKERYFGIAEGKSKVELIKKFHQQIYPSQEPRLALNKRAMIALNDILREYRNQNVLVIANGAVINSILASVSNHTVWSRITTLKNGSLSILNINEHNWLIESVNQTSHLNIYWL